MRSHDPSLSPAGERQVKQLGDGVARALLKPLSPRVREIKKIQTAPTVSKVRVAVSPMRRTLLTAVPVVQTLEDLHKKNHIELKSVDIVPHIFEIGGCYSEKNGIFMGHKGMTDSEAREILPNAIAPASMSQGWWSSSTRETEEELEVRVTKTLEWIRKTAWEGECDVLFIVTHQDFACTCMRRLTLAPGISWLYNTSLSSFTLHPLVVADMDPERVDQSADGTIARVYHCKVVMDWVNAVEHLSFENLT